MGAGGSVDVKNLFEKLIKKGANEGDCTIKEVYSN
jgi:hypothetical protein